MHVCVCVCVRVSVPVCLCVYAYMCVYVHDTSHSNMTRILFSTQLIGYNDEILDIALVGNSNSHIAVATNSEQARVFNRHSLNCQLLSGHSGMSLICIVLKKFTAPLLVCICVYP